eukprot:m.23645 g.23645  ORF g.23645 m.23645 type:complete len:56 (+) comp8543_c0_seq1:192-359(+)
MFPPPFLLTISRYASFFDSLSTKKEKEEDHLFFYPCFRFVFSLLLSHSSPLLIFE